MLFNMGSIAKTFEAALALQLAEVLAADYTLIGRIADPDGFMSVWEAIWQIRKEMVS